MNTNNFPFSAIVGQEALKTALLLNIVDPTIGGLLIRGQKGTGKSTAVRALANILPEITVVDGCSYHCPPDEPDLMHPECRIRFQNEITLPSYKISMPIVELPLNATEDRIAGSLHLEKTLQSGERHFESGLLAAANRGVLYVDEVNLLENHLVDILLDAAASGVNVVEREGISYSHPARFILIGTMNPEEGELRPQFLDRFGLCVEVTTIADPDMRKEIVKRRMSFEDDSRQFLDLWAKDDKILKTQIRNARAILYEIVVPEEMIELSIRFALEVESAGHRAEITIIKAARALAALLGKKTVGKEEICEAVRYALPHRNATSPLTTLNEMSKKIDKVIQQVFKKSKGAVSEGTADDDMDVEAMQIPGSAAAGSILFDFIKKKVKKSSGQDTTF